MCLTCSCRQGIRRRLSRGVEEFVPSDQLPRPCSAISCIFPMLSLLHISPNFNLGTTKVEPVAFPPYPSQTSSPSGGVFGASHITEPGLSRGMRLGDVEMPDKVKSTPFCFQWSARDQQSLLFSRATTIVIYNDGKSGRSGMNGTFVNMARSYRHLTFLRGPSGDRANVWFISRHGVATKIAQRRRSLLGKSRDSTRTPTWSHAESGRGWCQK